MTMSSSIARKKILLIAFHMEKLRFEYISYSYTPHMYCAFTIYKHENVVHGLAHIALSVEHTLYSW